LKKENSGMAAMFYAGDNQIGMLEIEDYAMRKFHFHYVLADQSAIPPARAYKWSSGIDFYSPISCVIDVGETRRVRSLNLLTTSFNVSLSGAFRSETLGVSAVSGMVLDAPSSFGAQRKSA